MAAENATRAAKRENPRSNPTAGKAGRGQHIHALANQLPRGRRKLIAVVRGAGDVIRIDDVVATLSVGRPKAAKLLARWTTQGWLRRVGRGAYVPASLDSLESAHVLEDPWVLVPALYAPAYISGWSAAEYWNLTEQIFRDIVVMTAQPVREKQQIRHGARYALHHIQEQKIFGSKPIWRGRSKVLVADVHRTIIDMLDNPALGGGTGHVADCLGEYWKRSDRDDSTLISYAETLGNGAVFKRLGFLAERRADASTLAEACHARLTKGNAKFDPALSCYRLASRWRLWVPQSWLQGRET